MQKSKTKKLSGMKTWIKVAAASLLLTSIVVWQSPEMMTAGDDLSHENALAHEGEGSASDTTMTLPANDYLDESSQNEVPQESDTSQEATKTDEGEEAPEDFTEEADSPEFDNSIDEEQLEPEAAVEEGIEIAPMAGEIEIAPLAIKSGTCGTCSWTFNDSTGELTISSGTLVNATSAASWGWDAYRAQIKTVTIKTGVKAAASTRSMFYEMTELTTINGLANLDTSNMTSARSMFNRCSSLTTINLSGWSGKVSKLKDTYYMFLHCTSVTSLTIPSGINMTSSSDSVMGMFQNCSALKTLDLSSLILYSNADVSNMLLDCSSLTTLHLGATTYFDGTAMCLRAPSGPSIANAPYTGLWLARSDYSAYKPGFIPSMRQDTYEAQYPTGVSISGYPAQGNTLTASITSGGTLTYNYQWMNSSDGSTYTNISGATASSYVVKAADAGKYLRCVVSYPSTGWSAYASGGVAFGGLVSLAGTPVAGKTITATALGASANPVSYQWYYASSSSGPLTSISGATSKTYNIANAYKGMYLKCTIKYGGYTASSSTFAVLGDVTISGNPVAGQVLTASLVNPGGYSVSYRWVYSTTSGGSYANISGATSSTYTVAAAYKGMYVKCIVTYSSSEISSSAVAIFNGSVTGSGIAAQGETLTAMVSGTSGYTVSYQWSYSPTSSGTFTNISGATSHYYTIPSTYVGQYIRCTVSISALGWSDSFTKGTVVGVPSIAGVPGKGNSLLASTTGSSGYSIDYQWSRSDTSTGTYTDISGANTALYIIADADVGKFLKCTARIGSLSWTRSVSIGVFGSLSISGTPAQGQVLTSTVPNLGSYSVSYQWSRADNAAGPFTNISGATAGAYTATSTDLGKYLKCTVSSGMWSSVAVVGPVSIAEGTWWRLNGAGELSIFANTTLPTASGSSNWPWHAYRSQVKTAVVGANVKASAGPMASMFYMMPNLTSIGGLENLDISKATTVGSMFRGCTSLASLNLSSFKTSSSVNMDDFFTGCTKLTKVQVGANFYFNGATSYLPVPTGTDSDGNAYTGRWESLSSGTAYEPSSIPNNVAATYAAETEVEEQVIIVGEWVVGAPLEMSFEPNPDRTEPIVIDLVQWYRGDTIDGTFTAIAGADSPWYTLQTADAGKYIRLTVVLQGGQTSSDTIGPIEVGIIAPDLETAELNANGTVTLSYTANASASHPYTHIVVEYRLGEGSWITYGDVEAAADTVQAGKTLSVDLANRFSGSSLPESIEFRIKAKNTKSTSAWSNIVGIGDIPQISVDVPTEMIGTVNGIGDISAADQPVRNTGTLNIKVVDIEMSKKQSDYPVSTWVCRYDPSGENTLIWTGDSSASGAVNTCPLVGPKQSVNFVWVGAMPDAGDFVLSTTPRDYGSIKYTVAFSAS